MSNFNGNIIPKGMALGIVSKCTPRLIYYLVNNKWEQVNHDDLICAINDADQIVHCNERGTDFFEIKGKETKYFHIPAPVVKRMNRC